MMMVSLYSGMMDMVDLLARGGLVVFDVIDDCGSDDSGCDGEYWEEHGSAPLLRLVVVLPGSFPDAQHNANPVPTKKHPEIE